MIKSGPRELVVANQEEKCSSVIGHDQPLSRRSCKRTKFFLFEFLGAREGYNLYIYTSGAPKNPNK